MLVPEQMCQKQRHNSSVRRSTKGKIHILSVNAANPLDLWRIFVGSFTLRSSLTSWRVTRVFKRNLNIQRTKDNYVLFSSTKGSEAFLNFAINPTVLINELVAYIQMKKKTSENGEAPNPMNGNSTTLLGKFAGFLANTKKFTQNNIQGILTALKSAVNINQMHDLGS